ncbi:MAG: hypothetical protein AAF830_13755 [Pseudomonadota bacterium]
MTILGGVAAAERASGISAEAGSQLGMEPVSVALRTVTALLAMGTIAN